MLNVSDEVPLGLCKNGPITNEASPFHSMTTKCAIASFRHLRFRAHLSFSNAEYMFHQVHCLRWTEDKHNRDQIAKGDGAANQQLCPLAR